MRNWHNRILRKHLCEKIFERIVITLFLEIPRPGRVRQNDLRAFGYFFVKKLRDWRGRTGLWAYLDRKSVRVRDRASIRSILIDIGFFCKYSERYDCDRWWCVVKRNFFVEMMRDWFFSVLWVVKKKAIVVFVWRITVEWVVGVSMCVCVFVLIPHGDSLEKKMQF